ncbi:MAG: hypothetical protein JOZ99_11960, partial [Actinobacteria bacterium]|nr:hypothetical protein [Actinomycetota bacterium]
MAGKSRRPGAGRGRAQRRSATVRPGSSGGPKPATAARLSAPAASPRPPDTHAGDGIIVASWVSVAFFVVAAVPSAAGVSALDGVAVGVPFALFLIGTVLM